MVEFGVWLLLFLNVVCAADGGLTQCCGKTTKPECRMSCEMLKLNNAQKLTTRKRQRHNLLNRKLTNVVIECPRSQNEFWKCLPKTKVWKDYVRRQQSKRRRHPRHHGMHCCKEARHKSCQLQCYTSRNVTNILVNENCNQIREPKLRECVTRIHASRKCCKGAHGECKSACKRYFEKSYYKSVLDGKIQLERKCGKHSAQYQCLMKQSDFKNVIKDFTMCCSKGGSPQCEQACQQGLQQLHNYSILLDESLPKSCGKFDIQQPIYKCFVDKAMDPGRSPEVVPVSFPLRMSDRTVIERRGPGRFREQCCYRAKSRECRSWCTSMTTTPSLMGTWEAMYVACIQDPREKDLSNCMLDILEPCEIGVKSRMEFCTSFNHRPLELFRRCDAHGDNEAKKLYSFWSAGYVRVLNYNLYFKDISKCKPEKFKAMACLISIKPCDHLASRKQVCRRDCEELLDTCLDHEKTTWSLDEDTVLHGETVVDKPLSARQVCADMLPKDNQTGCLSVKDYMSDEEDQNYPVSSAAIQKIEVTQPCDGNPCGKGEVCVINRACLGGGVNRNSGSGMTILQQNTCQPYTCLKGCGVSKQNNVLIPIGTRAKLRVDDRAGRECYQVCVCKLRTSGITVPILDECIKVGCRKRRSCKLKEKIFNDAEEFTDGCNTCTCDDGELLCTKNLCANRGFNDGILLNGRPRRHYMSSIGSVSIQSPCRCEAQPYNPVCGINGMTYPNPCLAGCWRPASARQPDKFGRCSSLDPCRENPCSSRQERCVVRRTVCLSANHRCPQYICTRDSRFEPTGCLSPAWKQDTSLPVCGFNGEEYRSECLALASGTGVDYYGPCIHTGENVVARTNCDHVKCPPVFNGECELFVPPGACCPVCGSMIRILYSDRDLRRHDNFIVDNDPITVIDIVQQLRYLQKVAECTLYGHRTMEGDLVILINVNTNKPTKRQIHACVTEAERINKYINNASPVMIPFYHLSILKVSRLKRGKWKDLGSSAISLHTLSLTSSCSLFSLTSLLLCSLVALLLTSCSSR